MDINHKKTGSLIIAILLTISLANGCSPPRQGGTISIVSPNFFGISEQLARQLIQNRRQNFGKGERLIFTTIVNLDQLHTTSKFGRALSESLTTQLFQHGYGIEEIRKISGILIKDDEGEIILSREAARLAKEHEADIIVAGTYALTPRTIIINIKFLDVISKEVISVAGLELQRSHSINFLLTGKNSGPKGIPDSELSAYEL